MQHITLLRAEGNFEDMVREVRLINTQLILPCNSKKQECLMARKKKLLRELYRLSKILNRDIQGLF